MTRRGLFSTLSSTIMGALSFGLPKREPSARVRLLAQPLRPFPSGEGRKFAGVVVSPSDMRTLDATAFRDLLERNAAAVGDAVASALQNNHDRLSVEIRAIRTC
jgi:hypothetical protein